MKPVLLGLIFATALYASAGFVAKLADATAGNGHRQPLTWWIVTACVLWGALFALTH